MDLYGPVRIKIIDLGEGGKQGVRDEGTGLEYAARGLTVNNIAPSLVDMPSVHLKQAAGMLPSSDVLGKGVPVGWMGTGADIAAACSFLCLDAASYVAGQLK
jgi:2-hydroxycyclohexanecarboxyl-CoA dehydrogenase